MTIYISSGTIYSPSERRVATELLVHEKDTDSEGHLTEVIVWRVDPNSRQPDGFRYRFAFVPHGSKEPAILYDNHHPKGHHRHVGGREVAYRFSTIAQLQADFRAEVAAWRGKP